MATTATAAALPSLEPLFTRHGKRTRDVFASCPDDGIDSGMEKMCATGRY